MRQQPGHGDGRPVNAVSASRHAPALVSSPLSAAPTTSAPPPSGDQAIGGTPRSCRKAISPLVNAVMRLQAQLDLVGDQRCRHRRLQQRPVVRPEVRHADRADLAAGDSRIQRAPRCRWWSISGSGRWISSRSMWSIFISFSDISTEAEIWSRAGVVIFHARVGMPPDRRDDVAFGDDLDLVAQLRCRFQRVAQQFLGL